MQAVKCLHLNRVTHRNENVEKKQKSNGKRGEAENETKFNRNNEIFYGERRPNAASTFRRYGVLPANELPLSFHEFK